MPRSRSPMALIVAVMLAVAGPALAADGKGCLPPLVPYPRALQQGPALPGPVRSVVVDTLPGPSHAAVAAMAARLQAEAEAALSGSPGAAAKTAVQTALRVRLALNATLPMDRTDAHGRIDGKESYTLVSEARGGRGDGGGGDEVLMTVAARAVEGLFYGTRTALHLLAGHGRGPVPAVRIDDAPVSSYRGIMVDNVRKPHDAGFHMGMLDKLAALKLNIYHLHNSDDQGYALPSASQPQLPMGSALTAAEVASLQAKAAALHMTIVSEVDLPGHSRALTAKVPALRAVSSRTGQPCNSINITSPTALGILQTLLAEGMAYFPGPYLHLGSDEVRFDADCNMTKTTYHAFINTMAAWARTHNRTTIVWGGFDPNPGSTAPTVDKEVIVSPFDVLRELPWLHRPHHYYDQGYSVINTAWNPLYIAGAAATAPEQLAEWNPTKFGKYPPFGCAASQYQSLPADNWNNPHYISGFDGLNATCWPDNSAHSSSYIPSPYPADRIRGGAVCSWSNPQESEAFNFFGDCFGKLPADLKGMARPAPRAAIAADRLWGGAAAAPTDVLERVGCAFWQTSCGA